jgi:hypothetical protein
MGSSRDPAETVGELMGKLAVGATRADAERDILLLEARLRAVDSRTFHDKQFYVAWWMVNRYKGPGNYLPRIRLVVGGATCVLLIACTNVGLLMLARGARRRGEMVVRASLGASRWQLVR